MRTHADIIEYLKDHAEVIRGDLPLTANSILELCEEIEKLRIEYEEVKRHIADLKAKMEK